MPEISKKQKTSKFLPLKLSSEKRNFRIILLMLLVLMLLLIRRLFFSSIICVKLLACFNINSNYAMESLWIDSMQCIQCTTKQYEYFILFILCSSQTASHNMHTKIKLMKPTAHFWTQRVERISSPWIFNGQRIMCIMWKCYSYSTFNSECVCVFCATN